MSPLPRQGPCRSPVGFPECLGEINPFSPYALCASVFSRHLLVFCSGNVGRRSTIIPSLIHFEIGLTDDSFEQHHHKYCTVTHKVVLVLAQDFAAGGSGRWEGMLQI